MEFLAGLGTIAIGVLLFMGINKCDAHFDAIDKARLTKMESCAPLCAPYHVSYVSEKGCVCDMTKKDANP